jgi:flagellar hook-length control protein FliK
LLFIRARMDAAALSNSLFVGSLTAAPWQGKGMHMGPGKAKADRSVEQADAPEANELIPAEQGQVTGGDEVEFKDALDEQTTEQGNQEPTSESDKSAADETASNDSVSPAISGLNIKSVGQNVEVTQSGPGQRALAVLTYLSEVKLADNPGKAAEAIGAVVEKMLARQGGEAENAPADQESEPVQEVAPEDVPQLPTATVGQTQPVVGAVPQTVDGSVILGDDTQEPEQTSEETAQPSGVAAAGAVQVSVNKEAESADSQQIEAAAAVASDKGVVTEVKKTGENGTGNKDNGEQPAQIGQAVEAAKFQVKDTGDKTTSKNDSGLSAQQGDVEQAVISTDKAGGETEKGADASKVLDAGQAQNARPSFHSSAAADKVGEQLQSSIANSVRQGESEVTVRLNPPELGRVLIKLQQDDGQITGVLEFSKAETRAEAQQFVPQLVRNLQDAGIAVKRLDVVQTQVDSSGQQQSREYVGQDGLAYQQQFSHGQPGNVGLGSDWAGAAESSYSGGELVSESFISDGAVNILV